MSGQEKDRYTTDRRMLPLHSKSRFRPTAQPILPKEKFYITDRDESGILGEGFLDYISFIASSQYAGLTIELDDYYWFNELTVYQVNRAAVLGLGGLHPFIRSHVWDEVNSRYGIMVCPTHDALPFYKTLRIWITNTTTSNITARGTFCSYRVRKEIGI